MNDEKLVLNRYLLQKRIALGGSAEVWHARDRKLNRAVAVKRLHAHLLPDAASRRRLAAEARAASRLAHPGIVEIYDVDTEGEMPVLVMELIDGESLAARLDRDGPLPADEAARIVADVCDALYHAHRQGIIHRDVKPGNVLLGRDGSTRLVDFGIAHSLAEAAERLTVDGSVVGTPRYMAPEQLTAGAIGPRTDLFGLGILLHEMLTGRSPFKATGPVALAEEQAAGPPPIHGIESPLAGLIRACLEPDPEMRPVHAGAIAGGLRAWLVSDPAPALAVAARQVPPAPEPSVESQAITQALPAVAAAPPAPPVQSPGPMAPEAQPAGGGGRVGTRLPVTVAAGLAAAALLGLVAMAFFDPARQSPVIAPGGSASVAANAATPTPPPAWLAGFMADYRDACGPDDAEQVGADLAVMDEENAKDHVEELIDACDEGKPGKGKGKGRGEGNGNDD
jgi:tRNA A-37 threonylcarbamoyl transferase component Bud32